ncbi:MAG: glycosyl transferase group 1 [Thermoplasmatales archaeon E-plasma]|nr:MAG: glycosyl transferase group 1 [Thermoplasmatales archaeon E-plasma]
MKIAFAMWGAGRTGGNIVIFNVADRLAGFGHEVVIVSLGPRGNEWFKFRNKVKVYYPEEKRFKSIRIRKKLFTFAEALNIATKKVNLMIDRHKTLTDALNVYGEGADILIATYFETAFSVYKALPDTNEKFYYIQHFESVFFNNFYDQKRVHETYFLPLKWIVNSSWALSKLTDLTKKSGALVNPGVDTKVFYPRNVKKEGKQKVIVSLGKRDKVKGIVFLFEALDRLAKKFPNIKLKLYGFEPSLKEESPVETEYIYGPSNDQLAELYSMADVVVTPSLYESSPLPPLEAMACGVPVITTQYGTEDFCVNDENSLVVQPCDPDAISNAMFRIFTEPSLARKLSENGIKKSLELSWELTASKVDMTLRSVNTVNQD